MVSTGKPVNRANFQLITRGYGPIGAPTKTLDEQLGKCVVLFRGYLREPFPPRPLFYESHCPYGVAPLPWVPQYIIGFICLSGGDGHGPGLEGQRGSPCRAGRWCFHFYPMCKGVLL